MILILLITFIVRGYIFFEFPILIKDIEWITIGKVLNQGYLLYKDIWDYIPPLAASLYWILFNIFGENPTYYHVFGTILLIIQAFLFNTLIINHNCFKHNTYIPALIYIFLSSLHIEMLTLSPTQISVTFLILTIHNVLLHIKDRKNIKYTLRIGFFLGITQLFYSSTYMFAVSIILFFILITGINIRHYTLVLFGFATPQLIVLAYFFLKNGAIQYINTFYSEIIDFSLPESLLTNVWLLLLVVPLLFFWFSLRIIFNRKYYNSQQINYQQFFIFWLIISLLSVLVESDGSPYQLHIIVPFLTFFLCIYFINIKNQVWAELLFLFFICSILFIFYLPTSYHKIYELDISFSQLKKEYVLPLKNEKILNLTNNINAFNNNNVAPPFFNGKLTLPIINNLDYKNITLLYDVLIQEKPTIILTESKEIMEKIATFIPTIKNDYNLSEFYSENIFIYKKK